jgi:Tfp pilus assembly protein PilX
MLRRFHRDERGVTLIFALFVSFVVLMLSIYVLDQATHNQSRAAYDRKRLTATNAAEAGLNWWFNSVQNSAVENVRLTAFTGQVISGPNTVSFTATPTYYADTTGNTAFSGALTATNYPKSVKVVSVGTASDGTKRQMETFVILHPIYSGFDGAMIANSDTTFSNSFTVSGNSGNDGDIVITNGNFTVPSGLESVKGSIYVATPGKTLTIGTQLHVYGQVWATGTVTLAHPQARVDGDAKSTSGSVVLTNGSVGGNAYYCTGVAPLNVTGSKIQTCTLGNPPTTAFPRIQWDQTAWESLGYYVVSYSGASACTSAQNYIEGNGSGTYKGGAGVPAGYTGVVVRLTGTTCTYSNSNNQTISVGSNLALVTDSAINLSQQSNWNGTGSTRNVLFISPYPSSGSPSCPAQDITFGNNTSFNNLVQVSVYTACTATMNNQNNYYGQVIGSTMVVGNNYSLTYRPVLIPGAKVTGFKEDISYIREVRAS